MATFPEKPLINMENFKNNRFVPILVGIGCCIIAYVMVGNFKSENLLKSREAMQSQVETIGVDIFKGFDYVEDLEVKTEYSSPEDNFIRDYFRFTVTTDGGDVSEKEMDAINEKMEDTFNNLAKETGYDKLIANKAVTFNGRNFPFDYSMDVVIK